MIKRKKNAFKKLDQLSYRQFAVSTAVKGKKNKNQTLILIRTFHNFAHLFAAPILFSSQIKEEFGLFGMGWGWGGCWNLNLDIWLQFATQQAVAKTTRDVL